MKNHPYSLVLSDGKRVRVDASSAAEAIEKARWEFRERMVIECFQGFDGQDPKYSGGGITYDVPEHSAVSLGAVQAKPIHRRNDQTETFGFFQNIILTNEKK
jgi:hypothetical protein